MESQTGDLEDWQEWNPSKLSFVGHMIAGSFAGLAEHVSIFPLDTLKTNIQCEKCGSSSPFKTLSCAQRIVKNDGILRLWRGVGAMFLGCIPAHAAYFSLFETMKTGLGADKEGHFPLEAALCGAAATFAHDFIMTPFDVVKQRLQLGYHKNLLDCARSILFREGPKALYLSFPTTVVMNLPYGCIMVSTNESVRKVLNPSGGYSMQTSMLAGCISGAVASLVTTPLDVVKTRLQTQNLVSRSVSSSTISRPQNALNTFATPKLYPRYMVSVTSPEKIPFEGSMHGTPRYSTMRQTIRRIIAEEGYLAFWKGALPRMMVHAPSVAVSWTAYELAKS